MRHLIEGRRVQLQPWTDPWMQGDRFGTIVNELPWSVTVLMERSGRRITMLPEDVVSQ